MVTYQRTALIVGLLTLAVCGCSRGTNETLEPGMMNEAEHTHYHVHAVDATHEHTHSALGGHTHTHKHPHSDAHL